MYVLFALWHFKWLKFLRKKINLCTYQQLINKSTFICLWGNKEYINYQSWITLFLKPASALGRVDGPVQRLQCVTSTTGLCFGIGGRGQDRNVSQKCCVSVTVWGLPKTRHLFPAFLPLCRFKIYTQTQLNWICAHKLLYLRSNTLPSGAAFTVCTVIIQTHNSQYAYNLIKTN